MKIHNKPLIKILIERIKNIRNTKIIVCTTTDKTDDILVKYLHKNHVKVFRGSTNDVLSRLYEAAKKFRLRQFVVVEGDDIFCDPDLIKETWDNLSKSNNEFVYWDKLPFGVSPLGIKTNKLCELIKNKETTDTDTGWGKFIIESSIFKIKRMIPTDKKLRRPEIRLSVDYIEDFKLVKKIHENLNNHFSLKDIIYILDKNPDWKLINEGAMKKYKKNFEKKANLMLKRREVK